MEVLLNIEDHVKEVHIERVIVLSSEEPTVENLMSELEDTFTVKPKYQEIFHGKVKVHSKLRNTLLSEIGIKNGDTLIVKHLILNDWVAFKQNIEHVDKLNAKRMNVKKMVNLELNRIERFYTTNFFGFYSRFEIETSSFRMKFAHYMDTHKDYMKSAAVLYFLQLYRNNPENPEFEVKFEEKSNPGAQGGLMCSVLKKGQLVKKYHIKSHLGTSIRSPDHDKVDLRELFVYQLLMKMKVGPNVYFITNAHHPMFGLYIATEDVCGFSQANVKRPSRREQLKLNLLSKILNLTDLHSANYGVDEKGNLYIVDFQLLLNYPTNCLNDSYTENIKEIGEDIKQWNLQTSLEEADQAIDDQKRNLSTRNIIRSATDDYKIYFKQIKESIERVLKIVEEIPEKKQKK